MRLPKHREMTAYKPLEPPLLQRQRRVNAFFLTFDAVVGEKTSWVTGSRGYPAELGTPTRPKPRVIRKSGQQEVAVGVLWAQKEEVGRRLFNDLTTIHYRNSITKIRRHTEVARYIQHRRVLLASKLAK